MAGCCSPARRRGSVLTGPRLNTLLAEVRSTIDQWAPLAACAALRGVNAAVVGLLLAALYKPVWTSAILVPADFAIGIVAFLLLALWAVPPWVVVILGAAAATVVAGIP